MIAPICTERVEAERLAREAQRELWNWVDNPARCHCEQCDAYAEAWDRAGDAFCDLLRRGIKVLKESLHGD